MDAINYTVIYKGFSSQTRYNVASLQDAANYIKNSGLNENYFIILNNLTGKESTIKEIEHYVR